MLSASWFRFQQLTISYKLTSIQRDALAAVSVELGASSSATRERTFDNGFLLRFGVAAQDARERRCIRRPWPTRLTSSELELRRRCSSSVASHRWRRSESRLGVAERRRLRYAWLSGRRVCCSRCVARWGLSWLWRCWAQTTELAMQLTTLRVRVMSTRPR